MLKNHWTRRVLLAAVWAMAVSTWSSIAHYLGGAPDFGPMLTFGVAIVILAWPKGATTETTGVLGGSAAAASQASRS